MGWLSYELGMRLRGVPSAKPAPPMQGHLKQYGAMIEYDAGEETCTVHATCAELRDKALALIQHLIRENDSTAPLCLPPMQPATASLDSAEYEDRVRQTLEHIRDGQVYQLNLSIRFAMPAPGLDSADLFFALLHHNPAPFYAWFASAEYRFLSTSPERFLKVEDGRVLSRPIKGTRVVQGNEDEARKALLASPKEHAELSMIVDLIRNDISHHCDYGSVAVANHCSVTRVDNLLQMHSDVTGMLRQDATCLDLLLDALPGGSITGCPKRRAMELIDELEPHARSFYCGSFVYIEDERTMDSSIAIRTAMHDTTAEQLIFYAGSGIVVDSNPAAEYRETLAKAAKFLGPKEDA